MLHLHRRPRSGERGGLECILLGSTRGQSMACAAPAQSRTAFPQGSLHGHAFGVWSGGVQASDIQGRGCGGAMASLFVAFVAAIGARHCSHRIISSVSGERFRLLSPEVCDRVCVCKHLQGRCHTNGRAGGPELLSFPGEREVSWCELRGRSSSVSPEGLWAAWAFGCRLVFVSPLAPRLAADLVDVSSSRDLRCGAVAHELLYAPASRNYHIPLYTVSGWYVCTACSSGNTQHKTIHHIASRDARSCCLRLRPSTYLPRRVYFYILFEPSFGPTPLRPYLA